MTFNIAALTADRPCGAQRGLGERIERAVVRHRKAFAALHVFMIVFYLALILIPPWLSEPTESAGPLTDFVRFSQFMIWCMWWPFVVLSMVAFGRAWCGVLCPEGALAAFASRWGGNRPVPEWMRWGGVPLLAFVCLTIAGQVLEVDEKPLPQLIVLGGSTLLAILISLRYRRKTWVWCRYLCPVSLLFGVFSRLGAMHFAVDRARIRSGPSSIATGGEKEPCPVLIHLPAMASNRYCVMCFRCAGWKDAIHLQFRPPGEELLRIDRAEPLFWEVMFLFGGAIGLPLGVFACERLESGPMLVVLLLLGTTGVGIALLSLLTWLSAAMLKPVLAAPAPAREVFTRLGYVYTPLSLFSLFLGLSQPTFLHLENAGVPSMVSFAIRGVLLAAGTAWSAMLVHKIAALHTRNRRRALAAGLPHWLGLLLTVAAWVCVVF